MSEERGVGKLAVGKRGAGKRLASAASATLGVISGLAPHVMHHIGLLTSVALFSGLGGTLIFGVAGLALSVPFLVRLYRRFDSYVAPAIALALFILAFAVSNFIIGPAIRANLSKSAAPQAESAPEAEPSDRKGQSGTVSTDAAGGSSPDGEEHDDEHHP